MRTKISTTLCCPKNKLHFCESKKGGTPPLYSSHSNPALQPRQRARAHKSIITMIQKIGVFLSSHDDVPESFHRATEAVGQWIGETKRTLVYGGSQYGLMEVLARATKAAGGRVYGVVPQILYDKNLVSEYIDVDFRVADLNDRKAVLMRESDICVALPGGIGTLDELLCVWAAQSIGLSDTRVVLFNVDNCWTPFVEAITHLAASGLVSQKQLSWLKVVSSVEELAAFVEEVGQ